MAEKTPSASPLSTAYTGARTGDHSFSKQQIMETANAARDATMARGIPMLPANRQVNAAARMVITASRKDFWTVPSRVIWCAAGIRVEGVRLPSLSVGLDVRIVRGQIARPVPPGS